MYYEINVSLNGNHYFATAPRSLLTKEKALKAYWDFMERFPAKDGFEIMISENMEVGKYFKPKKPRKKAS